MKSMTGYGSAAIESGALRASMRIRTVNHRNLDLVVRLPEEARPLELALRERLTQSLHRGRVELRLDLDDRRERGVEVRIDRSYVSALEVAQRQLEETDLQLGKLTLGDLLRTPEAVRILRQESDGIDSALQEIVLQVLEQALEEVESTRAREGRSLQDVLHEQIGQLRVFYREISEQQDEIQQAQSERLRLRLQELLGEGTSLDEGRLEQEIAVLADRSDVREELDRLSTHLTHFEETMAQTGPVGKKLDFLAQEISRELTTLGAKSRHAGVLARNVDAKLVCEQIREQIQNIE